MNEELQGVSQEGNSKKETEAPKGNEFNIYPVLRRLTLGFCVVVFLGILFFLMYLNGKSVYDSGI